MRRSLVPHTHAVTYPFQMRYARFIEGEGGEAGDAAAAAAAAAQQAALGGGAGTHAVEPQTPPAAPAGGWPEWDGKVESLPEPIRKTIEKARDDAVRERRGKQGAEADVVTRLAEVLGIDPKVLAGGDAAPTVESLSATVAQREQETAAEKVAREQAETDAAEARREAAVLRVASRLRTVDGDGLLDSREFMRTLSAIDPGDVAAVEKAVKEYAQKHPRFQVRVTGASGVDHTAGSGTGTTRPEYTLEEATARTMQGLN